MATRKTISIGGKNYKEGSKAATGAISSGGVVSTKSADIRANADRSKAATMARTAADPLSVAENMGAKIPGRIEAKDMQSTVDNLSKQLGTQLPPTPETIQTGQPSPTTTNAGQGLPGAVPQTGPGLTPQGAGTISPYAQAFQQFQGQPAPQSRGEALGTVMNSVPAPAADTSPIDTALAEDKGWQSLLQMKEEYFNPETQKASLMDTYNKLFKKSGLAQLDEEIIDAKTIIEGTEDDIRNEIEMAGGFGTDSQVQALALSRNKVLLKNFNNLVALRESKAEHLGTMMSLAEKDRAYADQQFDRMLNYDMQMLNYRDKFTQNVRDQYNRYEPGQLYAMLADNPRQLAFAEKILGIGEGGLQKAASYVKPLTEEETLRNSLLREQIQTEKAQRSNIYSQISDRNSTAQGEDDIGAYVTAYQTGQIPLTQVPAKVRGQVLAAAQASGTNKMLDLLGQYRNTVSGLNFFSSQSPKNRAMVQGLKGQITAEYKQQKQLGTLDAGVQTLIDSIIPNPSKLSVSALSNKAQVAALDNFIKNQGGSPTPQAGDTIEFID